MNENKELRNMLKVQQENHDKQISEIIPKIGNTNNKVVAPFLLIGLDSTD